MNYEESMQYIEEKNKLGIVPGLRSIRELLRRMGNPQDAVRVLHIAGTNGKGSVFAYVEQGLLAYGYRVGRYASPALRDYEERFTLDGVMIQQERTADLMTKVRKVAETVEKDGYQPLTAFEIETAMAFLLFAEEKVDFALVECGMGGRLDATNVVAHPVVTVFASIGMDHMQFLGDTIEKITSEKAGIIKPGVPVVSAPQEEAVANVIRETREFMGNPLVLVSADEIRVESVLPEKTTFTYKGEDYVIGLPGTFQPVNACVAVETLRILGVSQDAIKEGLRRTTWPGRMTKMCDRPLVYVDGAHNLPAWESLLSTVNYYFTNRRIVYIIGVLRDKDYKSMVRLLAPTMSCAFTLTPKNQRGLSAKELAAVIEEAGVTAVAAENYEEALLLAKKEASADDVIMVCGSLSFISYFLDRNVWNS